MGRALEGVEGVEEVLAGLSRALGRGAVRRVLMRAAEPVRAKAEALAPDDPLTPNAKDPGDLKTSIRIGTSYSRASLSSARDARRGPRGKAVNVYVGPTKDGYPQAGIKEFGGQRGDGQVIEATPYMAPAWEGEKNNALAIVERELGPEVTRTAERLARRLGRA
ncbi:MAG: hypothetical protein ACXW27_09100 [Allosphingosinicella sp.]